MRILLAAGGLHQLVSEYSTRKIDIVNSNGIMLKEIQNVLESTNAVVDAILITDMAFSQNDAQDKKALLSLLEWISSNHHSNVQLLFVIKSGWKSSEIEGLGGKHRNVKLIASSYVRVPVAIYKKAFEQLLEKSKGSSTNGEAGAPIIQPLPTTEKKPSFFDRLKLKSKSQSELTPTDQLTKDLEKISRGMSRVIAITGHRGSGVTSTAVNVASEASKRGLSTMIIDMDIAYRSMNMYFDSFHEMTKRDADINASLMRTLARPQDYMNTAFNLKNNFWVTGLGYEFSDQMQQNQMFNSGKLAGLLSMLRNKFNVVILDLPLDTLKEFKESMIHIDVFGLCVSNNLYSVLSTLKSIDAVLDKETIAYLNAKSRIVVSKYNDRARFQGDIFTADKVCNVLSSGVLDTFTYEVKAAGHVPYSSDFDVQIETDVPLVHTSRDYEHAYGNILLRLMEGAS